MTTPSHSRANHALIIGGGIAGLFTARILSEHFERVTLVERDHYPQEPTFRAGVPQGRHVHQLLLRGQQIVETLFPGIGAKLIAQGAVEVDFCQDFRYRALPGWICRFPSRLKGICVSRPFLEWQIYQELLHRYPVKILERHEVIELLATDGAQRVTGVRVRPRPGASEQNVTELSADLVVDASGRDSHLSQWLEQLGYAAPAETVINAYIGYASRLFLPTDDPARDWKGLAVGFVPPKNLRSGVIWPIEGGSWSVVVAGAGKDYPPADEAGFIEYARGLPDPALYEAIKDAQPLSPIYGYRRTENRLLHFERLARQPEGLVALGDAVCAFNPIYGQGMSVAALGALTLDECLRQKGLTDGFSHHFQQKLAKMQEFPWQFASSADLRVPGMTGKAEREMNRVGRWMQRYVDRVIEVTPFSARASRAFLEVIHLVSPPTVFFHPAIMLKVLTYRRDKHA